MSSDDKFYMEPAGEKFQRKLQENPMFAAGLAGLMAALGYGGYAYKNKGTMSTSVFLMQLRVSAQGMVVGALSIGMIYQTGKLLYKQMNEPS